MQDCFNQLEHCSHHLTFMAPNTPVGEGMLIELGYALKKGLKCILLIHDDIKSVSSQAVVDTVIRYQTMDDLLDKIKLLKIEESKDTIIDDHSKL